MTERILVSQSQASYQNTFKFWPKWVEISSCKVADIHQINLPDSFEIQVSESIKSRFYDSYKSTKWLENSHAKLQLFGCESNLCRKNINQLAKSSPK